MLDFNQKPQEVAKEILGSWEELFDPREGQKGKEFLMFKPSGNLSVPQMVIKRGRKMVLPTKLYYYEAKGAERLKEYRPMTEMAPASFYICPKRQALYLCLITGQGSRVAVKAATTPQGKVLKNGLEIVRYLGLKSKQQGELLIRDNQLILISK